MQAITFDPGVTTGIVKAEWSDKTLIVEPLQLKLTPLGLLDWMKAQTHGMKKPQFICEDFEFRPNSPVGLVMTSAHLIGVIMAFTEHYAIPLRMQKAGYAKGGYYRGMKNLKAAGVYVGGVNYEHSMDAMRHFMQWFYYGPGYKYNKSPQVVLKK